MLGIENNIMLLQILVLTARRVFHIMKWIRYADHIYHVFNIIQVEIKFPII